MNITTQHCVEHKAKVLSFPFRGVGRILYILLKHELMKELYLYIYIGSLLIKEYNEHPCDTHGSGVRDGYEVAWEDWCKAECWKTWAKESLRFIYIFSYLT